jgi:hypothetical protein
MTLEKCSILHCTPTEYDMRVSEAEDLFFTLAILKKNERR